MNQNAVTELEDELDQIYPVLTALKARCDLADARIIDLEQQIKVVAQAAAMLMDENEMYAAGHSAHSALIEFIFDKIGVPK